MCLSRVYIRLMQLSRPGRRRLQFEHVPLPQGVSLVVRDFTTSSFPFVWHYHPEVELTLILQGSGLRFVGESIERFSVGDVVLLGSNVPHSWASDARVKSCRSIVIQFDPARWGKDFNALPEMRRVGTLLHEAARGLALRGAVCKQVRALMCQCPTHGPASQMALLIQALDSISKARSVRALTRATVVGASPRVSAVLKRLNSDITQRHTQESLAPLAGVSVKAFSRFFKTHVGKTFVAYVNEWRVGLACRELVETDSDILSIAIRSGFENLSHFNRQFKRIVGATPRAYRADAAGATVVVA